MQKSHLFLFVMGKGKKKSNLPQFMTLVGLPGSGKSYFCKHLSDTNENVVIVSQDSLGCKSICEQVLIKAIKNKQKKVILDKCNPKVQDRQYWVDYSMLSKKDIVVSKRRHTRRLTNLHSITFIIRRTVE